MEFSCDRILIRFRSNTPRHQCLKIHQQIKATLIDEIKELNIHIVSVDRMSINSCLHHYSTCNEVEFAERDGKVKTQLVPNDPLLSRQWGLLKVNATRAWNITRGSTKVPIAILDTGICMDHPDLQDKLILNANFSAAPTAEDFYGHGTHVAGIAAAVTKNGVGVAGLAINPTLMNVKVLDDSGTGFDSDVARGIVFAANNGARVINMSLGGPSFSSTLHDAAKYAAGKGVILVAAAGNDGSSDHSYPAAFAQCISVAALERDDTKAQFSNFGATWVDLAAPGVEMLSTAPIEPNVIGFRNYGYLSGTSQATPLVSGLAALLLSLNSNANTVRNTIESTTVPISGLGTLYQHGRINSYNALLKLPRS
ncbi:S8 family serine peptidase [Alkalihalobacillus sp. AL-G]|uniref:S8 family serine peptidase n=1 Tax=Alkalihalobacillus sp. AL-G TaxID=2926399 RepID=UPI00272D21AD|nr:S8 family serine peptidase [Alkalihalobacillus sp. AL-G]WLD93964.1 S8 family serine peptidase [Alkalihalobacillus sp. AL-G]